MTSQRDMRLAELEKAAAKVRVKCEQYWNEHNIQDEEIHAALEIIHRWLTPSNSSTTHPTSAPSSPQPSRGSITPRHSD